MNETILIAILAASVSAFGWVANYIFSGRDERRKTQLDASLTYLESQLQELYGPLAFLIQESRRTHQDLLATLGREKVFVQGQELTDDELKVWLFWIENDILPRNDKIRELMTGKTHLIEGQQVPQSYLDFLEHHISWKINHLRWQKEQTKYPFHSRIPYPVEFEEQVLDTFQKLKDKHARILGERHVKEETLQPLPAKTNASSQEK